jgi:hypothetical protein
METYYKYHIMFALIVISLLILNPMTVHSQSSTIRVPEESGESEESERSGESEESERSGESEESERSGESEESEESESTTATKPGEETSTSISIEPKCITDILNPDCIPECPPDCLSEGKIRFTIDTGDGNPETIVGDKEQILFHIVKFKDTLVTGYQYDKLEQLVGQWADALVTSYQLSAGGGEPAANPSGSINCQVSTTIGGATTITCGATIHF